MGDTTTECALWYWRYHQLYVEMCKDEDDAVSSALGMSDSGEGSFAGVQFSDGRFVDRDQWTAYEEGQRRRDREFDEMMARERENPRPQPATREVHPPFRVERNPKMTVTVRADLPSWVGAQPAID